MAVQQSTVPKRFLALSSDGFTDRPWPGAPRNSFLYIHGPCHRFRGDQNDEDTRTFCGMFLYNAFASTDNAQQKNCPSRGIDDRPGRDLFRVLMRSPMTTQYSLEICETAQRHNFTIYPETGGNANDYSRLLSAQ